MAAEIIDLALVGRARRTLQKLLSTRGITYFLEQEGPRPFRIDASRVEMVLRVATRLRPAEHSAPSRRAVESCRKEIRRLLIREVAATMLQVGF